MFVSRLQHDYLDKDRFTKPSKLGQCEQVCRVDSQHRKVTLL